jgi:hypothetical protein
MLNEQRATGIHYDAETDALRIEVLTAFHRAGVAPATLLLDSAGHLVGIDIDPAAGARTVVMLGPHESVVRTVPTSANLEAKTLSIAKARSQCRGHDRNPYWTGQK